MLEAGAGPLTVTSLGRHLLAEGLAKYKLPERVEIVPELPLTNVGKVSKKLLRGCGGDSKQSTPTPASNGDLVFYVNAMGLCACYDLRGTAKWVRVVETAEDEEHFTASPVFVGDRVVLAYAR